MPVMTVELRDLEWCCHAFQGAFQAAGERDFAMLVSRAVGGYGFIFQHRAVELGDPGPNDHPRPISLVAEVQIAFCPWCGKRLETFYRTQAHLMVRPHLALDEPKPPTQ